jgi:hypothetical protein
MSYNIYRLDEHSRVTQDQVDPLLSAIESISYSGLRRYMIEQITSARNMEELVASVELVEEVLTTRRR